MIHDGDSILIDGGSTTAYVAKNLHLKSGLTVITTSIHLLPFLIEVPDIKIFLTGGFYFREFEELVGEISIESVGRFKPDHTIMGVDLNYICPVDRCSSWVLMEFRSNTG